MAKSNDRTLPLETNRGMYAGGDAAMMPSGHARKLRNVVRRARVDTVRPNFTYDNLASVRAFAIWYDSANAGERLIAINGTQDLFVKDVSAETWSAAVAGNLLWDDVIDSADFRGQLVMGVMFNGAEHGSITFNGATLSADTAISVTRADAFRLGSFTDIAPRSLATFTERLFLAAPRLQFTNFTGVARAYDATAWTLTNVAAQNVVIAGSDTVCRITPTTTTGAFLTTPTASMGISAPNGQTWIWRAELRGVHESYNMPVTLQVLYRARWGLGSPYDVGAIVTPLVPNGFRYRALVGGAVGGAEPVWPTTVASTVADGAVTWICDGSDVAAQVTATIPNVTAYSDFTPLECAANFPPIPNSLEPELRIVFGTTETPTVTLAALDFSLKDGKADSDPRKANHGQQFTRGAFSYPFFNAESSSSAQHRHSDYIYWSEVGALKLAAQNYYRLSGGGGPITVIREVSGKLVAFKRNELRVFGAVDDPRIVILPEGERRRGFGCLNPRAFDGVFEDYAYFIGENEIYRWRVGQNPEPLCGDAMRDEIMNKSASSWVESQAAPANRALLAVDQRNREVWVYTQKGKLFCYRIDDRAWSVHDAGGGPSLAGIGHQICDMAYNPTTGNMYFAFTTAAAGTPGVARLDPNVTPAEDSISTSGTRPVFAEIWPRPIETSTPAMDLLINTMRFYHKATADQTGQTTKASISFDQGVTFERELSFSLSPLSNGGFVPLELPLFQSWSTVLARLVHQGKGGAANFAVSRIEADIQVLRGSYPKNAITHSASTL